MIKITLYAIVLTATLLYIAETKVTYNPFKITFAKGWFAVGMALIGLGIGFIRYQAHKDGVKDGIKGSFEYLKEEIKKEIKQ